MKFAVRGGVVTQIHDEVLVDLPPSPSPNYDLADVVDVLAAMDDPTSAAAHRVKLATDAMYASRYFQDILVEQLRVPRQYLMQEESYVSSPLA